MFATVPPAPHVVISAPFTSNNWTFGRTSAFPGPDASGTQRNPTDGKLDCLNPKWSAPTGTTFQAVRSGSCWNADLATSKVLVKTGDKITYNVTPQAQKGSWPAIWTWKDGGNELDLFEYHGDFPKQVEFANHVTHQSTYRQNVTPGGPYQVTVTLGTKAVTWQSKSGYVMYTAKGLPANWSSYLIVSMSVDNGMYSAAQGPPTATEKTLSMKVNSLTVTR